MDTTKVEADAPEQLPPVIDSHMHLDLMFRDHRICSRDTESLNLMELFIKRENLHVEKVVANYCFPIHWPSSDHHLANDHDRRVYPTYGIHPKVASENMSDACYHELAGRVSNPRCVAIGEVGLDFYHNDSSRDIALQKRLLGRIFDLAKARQQPLVNHSRERREGEYDAAYQIMQLFFEKRCLTTPSTGTALLEQSPNWMSGPITSPTACSGSRPSPFTNLPKGTLQKGSHPIAFSLGNGLPPPDPPGCSEPTDQLPLATAVPHERGCHLTAGVPPGVS